MPTKEDLKYFQAMPLDIKIGMTKTRIREWVSYYGIEGVYVSFSGGKDSTVLLHLVRGLYPDIPAVFVDTGLEYPEIRAFVKTFDNVVWLKPEKSFKQVIEEYGYPIISKEVSDAVQDVLRYIKIHNIKIASVYGDVVADEHINGDTIINGQKTIYDYLPESLTDSVKLKTTGCKRTGCMFCGFGCHLEKDGAGRFELMKKTHPKQYDYIMRPTELGGLNFKEVIDWINEKGQLNIRY